MTAGILVGRSTSGAEGRRGWAARLGMLAVAVFAAVVGGVLHAPAAAAHGGPYDIEVHNDGAGGVQVFAYYVEDGHLVEAIMDPVVEAVSADGLERGPIRLVSSAEGQGRWLPEEPFLEPGDWTVTVTTTTPEETSVTTEFTVEPFDPPIETEQTQESAAPEPEPAPSTTAEADPAGEDGTAAEASDESGSTSLVTPGALAAAAAIVVVLAAMLVIAMRRRRATRDGA